LVAVVGKTKWGPTRRGPPSRPKRSKSYRKEEIPERRKWQKKGSKADENNKKTDGGAKLAGDEGIT